MPRCGIAFENPAHFQARHLRQHQIENDEVRLFLARFVQTGNAVTGRGNDKAAGFAQTQCEKIDNVLLVLDDKNGFAQRRVHPQQIFGISYFDSPATLGLTPICSFSACVNSCRLETICGALLSTVVANFSA